MFNSIVNSKFIAAAIALFGVLSTLLTQAASSPQPGISSAPSCQTAGDKELAAILRTGRERHQIPAIAAAWVTSDGLQSCAVAGTRKKGSEIAATLNDKWHLGSDCKAMTAVLMARLVEKGMMRWDTTVGECFPEFASDLDPDARAITVNQLLSHRSGLAANPNLREYRGTDGRAERLRLVKTDLSKALKHKPGSNYEYSNLGYAVAGAISEKITGKSWETLMTEHVFAPLEMTSVGFGGTGTPGRIDQPWGHDESGKAVRANGPFVDNPAVLSPAGRVHCTIQDWAKFITDQLRGARGEKALLKPESYRKLHAPPLGQEYALGWVVVDRPWGGGKVLNHAGDNTMNFANAWVAPERNFAVLVCVNQSGGKAFAASDEVVGAIIRLREQKTSVADSNSK